MFDVTREVRTRIGRLSSSSAGGRWSSPSMRARRGGDTRLDIPRPPTRSCVDRQDPPVVPRAGTPGLHRELQASVPYRPRASSPSKGAAVPVSPATRTRSSRFSSHAQETRKWKTRTGCGAGRGMPLRTGGSAVTANEDPVAIGSRDARLARDAPAPTRPRSCGRQGTTGAT